MTKYLVKIDRNSIKKNPNAGSKDWLVPGRIETSWHIEMGEDEKPKVVVTQHRNIQRVYSIFPEPADLFKYIPTQVKCKNCGKKSIHDELESDCLFDGENEIYIENICPHCSHPNCCELEYEEMNERIIPRRT